MGCSRDRIVVTGVGLVTPFGGRWEDLWEAVISSRSAAVPLRENGWKDHPVRHACPVEPAPAVARKADRAVQFAVAAAVDAARMSGLPPKLPGAAVILGSARGPLAETERAFERPSPGSVERTMMVSLSAAVARELGAGGANFVVSATCASSAHALGMALGQLRSGAADCVIAGGSEACLTPRYLRQAWESGIVSSWEGTPAEACRPFDRRRCGTVFGEGAVVFVLEREVSARRRKADALFELAGYGAASDPERLHAGTPEGEGVHDAARRCTADAGLDPEEIAYVHAHAPGTLLGDVMEARALRRLAMRVPVSSTKGVTGHWAGAAGALGVAVTGMALRRKLIPPTTNLEAPGEECELEHVMGAPREFRPGPALVVSSGFGGTNAVLALRPV